MQYNFDKHFLGSICKHRHEFETSGKGLRYLSNYCCVECIKLRSKKYYSTDKGKEYQKVFRQSDKGKECQKVFRQSDKGKECQKVFRQSDKGKEAIKRHNQTEKGKASLKRARQSDKGKVSNKRHRQSDKGKEARKAWNHKQSIEHAQHAIGNNLRTRIRYALNCYTETGKIKSLKKYGIKIPAIIKYLGPHPNTLGIKGKHHIDHRVPLSLFNLNNPEHIKVAFDPLNHQWLTEEENLKKGNKIPRRSDIPKALLKSLIVLD